MFVTCTIMGGTVKEHRSDVCYMYWLHVVSLVFVFLKLKYIAQL